MVGHDINSVLLHPLVFHLKGCALIPCLMAEPLVLMPPYIAEELKSVEDARG